MPTCIAGTLALTGCSKVNPITTPVPDETQTTIPIQTVTFTPTLIPTSNITQPTPTSTRPAHSQILTPTISPTPTPTSTVILNPVEEYANNIGLSDDIISMLKPLDKNGVMNKNEEGLIDELYILPDEVRKDTKVVSILKNITQDESVTIEELARFQDLDQDTASNQEELSVYQTNPLVAEKWDDFDTVTGILNTPEKVSTYMRKNIKYVYEPRSSWQSALETFTRKAGQCGDQAMFADYLLLKAKYKAQILVAGEFSNRRTNTHAVCLYQYDKVFEIIDDGIKRGQFSTIEDVAHDICNRAGWSYEGYELYDINQRMIFKK